MNIWIAKINKRKSTIDEKKELEKSFRKISKSSNKDEFKLFEYTTDFVHYLSFQKETDQSAKNYNFVHPEKALTAYSGLLVGKTSSKKDYRLAESIKNFSHDPVQFSENVFGHFAVIYISENRFQCFTDNKSYHNVYYYESDSDEIYISNSIQFIKLFKKQEFNYEVLLDWLALETLLYSETEEKNVFMIPPNGVLKWGPEEGLSIDNYKELEEILYAEDSEKKLLHTAVSELRCSAEYLSSYHDCNINLSGGFDSRLVASMFWGLDKSRIESVTYSDNTLDLSIAKKVARNHSLNQTTITGFDELPAIQELHDDLVFERFPFVKYSSVFNYIIKNSLEDRYNDRYRVILKGYGGNADRRISENKFLLEFEGEGVIDRFTEHLIGKTFFLREETYQYLKKRIHSAYSDEYLSIIERRESQHKFNCILFWERFNHKINRNAAYMAPPFYDSFNPLLMDSFQTLIFNVDPQELIRNKKQGLYHKLFELFTHGEDKPMHFTSGLHWEASKLSRALYRFKRSDFVQQISDHIINHDKMTTKVKNEFLIQNKTKFLEILQRSDSSFLWEYINRDQVIQKFKKTTDYNDPEGQVIFQKVIPILKMEENDAF